MMFVKSLVVFVAFVGVASAHLTPKEEQLYLKKAELEAQVLSNDWWISAQKVFETAQELEENIYKELPIPERPSNTERWTREIVNAIYSVGQVSKENCESLKLYNTLVTRMTKQCSQLKNVVKTLKHYQQKQMKLC